MFVGWTVIKDVCRRSASGRLRLTVSGFEDAAAARELAWPAVHSGKPGSLQSVRSVTEPQVSVPKSQDCATVTILDQISSVHTNRHLAFRRVRKIVKSCYELRHVCQSIRLYVPIEQFGSHWTHFNEIWYLRIFRKSVEKIQVWLKSDKNNGYFTWRPKYSDDNI